MSIRHDRDLRYQKSRKRKARPKTFKSEKAADEYAKEKGIKDYTLLNLRSSDSKRKKIRIEK